MTQSSQSQSGSVSPWGPSIGPLSNILGQIGGMANNAPLTPTEQAAINQWQQAVNDQPNYTKDANNVASELISGGTDYRPMVQKTNADYQARMNPYANGDYLDPMKAPGMGSVLDTIRSDVSNSVNGMFAGAGRDMSGLNQQSLARGIAQGEAAPLLDQYNKNVGNQFNAANGVLGAGMNAAGTMSDMQQVGFNNKLQGLNTGINTAMQAATAKPMGVLQSSQAWRGIPVNYLGQLASVAVPIAGLGKQYEGTSTSTPSVLSSIGQAAGIAGSFKGSDRRMKDDILEVGKLHDGQIVYSYRYKDDPHGVTHIGLMADEVMRHVPEAVGMLGIGDLLGVDYKKATANAAREAK